MSNRCLVVEWKSNRIGIGLPGWSVKSMKADGRQDQKQSNYQCFIPFSLKMLHEGSNKQSYP